MPRIAFENQHQTFSLLNAGVSLEDGARLPVPMYTRASTLLHSNQIKIISLEAFYFFSLLWYMWRPSQKNDETHIYHFNVEKVKLNMVGSNI